MAMMAMHGVGEADLGKVPVSTFGQAIPADITCKWHRGEHGKISSGVAGASAHGDVHAQMHRTQDS